jgi:MarR family transcriptional regulator, organic hydroperoxide resistance regulator
MNSESLDFLIANISHLHHARAEQLLEALGLYRGQPPVLYTLWKREGMTQAELAENLRVTPATMTRMLQRMEKTGFISRRPDEADQRITRVYLTDAGRAVRSELEGGWARMEAETFAGFSAEEQEVLRGWLARMRANLVNASGKAPWKLI